MSRPVALVCLHGVGRQRSGWSAGFAALVAAQAPGLRIHAVECCWAPVCDRVEDELERRVMSGRHLRWNELRRFLLEYIGDAVAYQPDGGSLKVQEGTHACLDHAFAEAALLAGPTAPLVLVGHSLGTVIACQYLWDIAKRRNDSPLQGGETLCGLLTMGSPIALFALGRRDFGKPPAFPHPRLATHLPGARATWLNAYDADDVVAFPLRGLNADYAAAVSEDVRLSVGGPLDAWNPACHGRYWDSHAAAALAARLCREAAGA